MSEPITNITILQESCQYHCRPEGWLIHNGTADDLYDHEADRLLPLIMPQSDLDYRPCFNCNELSSINDDLGDVFV